MSDLERIKPSLHAYLPKEGMNIFQKAGRKIALFVIGILEHAKETGAMLSSKKREVTPYEEVSLEKKAQQGYGSIGVTIRAPSGSVDSATTGISSPRSVGRSPASSIGSDPGSIPSSPRSVSPSLDKTSLEQSSISSSASEISGQGERDRTLSSESGSEAAAASSKVPYLSDAEIKKEMKAVAKVLETLPILNKKEIKIQTPLAESQGFIFNASTVSEPIAEATKKCLEASKELYEQFQRMEAAIAELEIIGGDPKALDEEKGKLESFVKDNPVFKELYSLKEYLKASAKDKSLQELTFLNIDKAPVSETAKEYLEQYLIKQIWEQSIQDLGGRQEVTIVYGRETLFSRLDLKGKELDSYVSGQKKSQELLNTLASKLIEKNPALTPKEAKRKLLNLFLKQSQGKEAIDLTQPHIQARAQFEDQKERLAISDSLDYKPIGTDFEHMIPDVINIDLKTDTVIKTGMRFCKIVDGQYDYSLKFPMKIRYETKMVGPNELTLIKSDGISLKTASFERF